MKMSRKIFTLAIMFLSAIGLVQAQSDSLQIQNVTVVVTDRSGRLFDAGTLETTLISAPGYEAGQTLGTESLQFSVGDTAKSFPIRDGRADTRLLVQGDTSKDPFKYQFAGKSPDGSRFVSKTIDVTPNTKSLTLVAPDVIAPHTRMETLLEIAFLVIAFAAVLRAFFYMGFRRMLFNKRMEVESAATASTILSLVYLLIAVVIAAAAWGWPDLLSGANRTYLILCSIFLVLFGFGVFLMIFFTRKPVIRS